MMKQFNSFRFCLMAGALALFMVALTAGSSQAQLTQVDYEDSYEEVDSVISDEPVMIKEYEGLDGGGGVPKGCYTISIIDCYIWDKQTVRCHFTGVYGSPTLCQWTTCNIIEGGRRCVYFPKA